MCGFGGRALTVELDFLNYGIFWEALQQGYLHYKRVKPRRENLPSVGGEVFFLTPPELIFIVSFSS